MKEFQYLLTGMEDGVFQANVWPSSILAGMIAYAGNSGMSDIRIYRLLPHREPQPITYHVDAARVWLYDCFGNLIEMFHIE